MLVLIDESGCPGFKLTKGSTPFFVVGMVIFKDFSQAEAASKAITDLRQTLSVNPEFKFSKTHPTVKDKFFDELCQYDFEVRALVVDKNNIYSQKRNSPPRHPEPERSEGEGSPVGWHV